MRELGRRPLWEGGNTSSGGVLTCRLIYCTAAQLVAVALAQLSRQLGTFFLYSRLYKVQGIQSLVCSGYPKLGLKTCTASVVKAAALQEDIAECNIMLTHIA